MSWSFAGGNISSSTSTNPSVRYDSLGTFNVSLHMSNANGNVHQTTTISVVPYPTVSMSINRDSLCTNAGPVILTGSHSGGIFSGSGVSGQYFTPSLSLAGHDTLTYFYTDVNGCSNMAKQVIKVVICTGIPDITTNGQLSVYPNPNSAILNIESGLFVQDNVTINVYDVSGRSQSVSSTRQGNTIYVSTEGLADGMYMVKIQVGDKEYSKTFVKK
jgi:PKD repeat protein